MAGPNPLNLPEICDILARFLTYQDLTVCSRVSKDWYLTFEPHIWRNIKILPKNSPCSKVLTKANLKLHSDFIGQLTCIEEGGDYLEDLTCRYIQDLSLNWRCPFQRDFALRHHTTVQCLSLNLHDFKDEVWESVLSCPALESLSLKHAYITEPNLSSFKSLWVRLRCLELSHFELRVGNLGEAGSYNRTKAVSFLKELPYSKIRELKLASICGLSTKEPLMFLMACPLLEAFVWYPNRNTDEADLPFGDDDGEVGFFLTELAQHCPKLVSVHVFLWEPEDEGILPLLRSRTHIPLEQLSVQFNWFTEVSWRLLKEHHFSTLRLLNLRGCSIGGEVVQDILCSLPRLETFVAPWLRDYDIDSRPWVCLGLKRLTVSIDLTKKASQRMIFLRLAKLRQLRHLDLTGTSKWFVDHNLKAKIVARLKFKVNHGLGLLKTLVNLEQLILCETGQLLTEDDVEWMLENWPQLRALDGSLAKERKLDRELRELLDQSGVDTNFADGLREEFTDGGVREVEGPRICVTE